LASRPPPIVHRLADQHARHAAHQEGYIMSIRASLIGAVTFAVLAASSIDAKAETAREKAMNAGAEQLKSEEIAELIVGKTVTARSGEKTFYFHYSRG
jgi:hypothetical protein